MNRLGSLGLNLDHILTKLIHTTCQLQIFRTILICPVWLGDVAITYPRYLHSILTLLRDSR